MQGPGPGPKVSPTGATAERRKNVTSAGGGAGGEERGPSPLGIVVDTSVQVPAGPAASWFSSPQRFNPVGPLTNARLLALFGGVAALLMLGTVYRVTAVLSVRPGPGELPTGSSPLPPGVHDLTAMTGSSGKVFALRPCTLRYACAAFLLPSDRVHLCVMFHVVAGARQSASSPPWRRPKSAPKPCSQFVQVGELHLPAPRLVPAVPPCPVCAPTDWRGHQTGAPP